MLIQSMSFLLVINKIALCEFFLLKFYHKHFITYESIKYLAQRQFVIINKID